MLQRTPDRAVRLPAPLGLASPGISQRASSNYFPFLLDAQPTITRTILKFFYTVVHRRFPLDACTTHTRPHEQR